MNARAPVALGFLAVAAALVAVLLGTVMALLGAELACVGGGAPAGAAPSQAAVREIPAPRLRIYQAAGRHFDIDWAFLASIGTQECGVGLCAQVYPSGCGGPMQIAIVRESACSPGPGPTIWERFEVDGDGDGRAEPFDLADSIFTAAHILRADLGAPPVGGSYAAYRQAACSYYGACSDSLANYADEVMARAVEYGFAGKGAAAQAPGEVAAGEQGPSCEAASGGGGASGSAIVRVAESQLGRAESPPGSNCTPYGPCEEWCALFVAWVWQHAGIRMRGGTAPFAYSGSIEEWAKANGRVLPVGLAPAPGDAVLFGYGPTASEHVAIVEQVFPDGEIVTIDGNFGDRVARVGPFPPALAVTGGEPAPIYAYAQPPGVGTGGRGALGG